MGEPREPVGFLVHTPEMVHHYGPVWRRLGEGAFELVVHGDATTKSATFELVASHRWLAVDVDEALASGVRWRTLVSNHAMHLTPATGQPLITTLGDVNVRFMYSLGKSRHNFSDWNALYQMILCFGPWHATNLANVRAVKVQMGYPRYDANFLDPPDRDDVLTDLGCDPRLPTILWLPTWHNVSSIDRYARSLADLASSGAVNVIAKPHPLTVAEEPHRVELLRSLPFSATVLDLVDNGMLLTAADLVAADYGGPAFGAIYLDKPVVLLDVPNAAADELIGPESLDILLRDHIPSVDEANVAGVLDVLRQGTDPQQRAVRRQLRELLFAPYRGFSSDVAAAAIRNVDHVISGA